MRSLRHLGPFLLLSLPLIAAPQAAHWKVPTATRQLPNGLVVVVSEDHSAPTVGICVSYGIGFRLEPEGRTGFAHLFEHMMFEGTPVAPKGVFDQVIESGGGNNNGDTRWDFTEYIETAPVSATDALLWLEADRMKTLDFSPANLENQRNVVEEEVRVNVLNQPYGLFYGIDLPMAAYDKYPNAHNFYGDFKDLDAANIKDVEDFYNHYYAPNNAVLAVAGDVVPDEIFAKTEKYFGTIPRREVPARPDVTEAAQKAERRKQQTDKLANVPALAIGYRMPDRGSPEAMAGVVLGELLHNGQASLFYQSLVKEKKLASSVDGGVNWPLGSPLEYNGPTLMATLLVYNPDQTADTVLAAYDQVIAGIVKNGPSAQEMDRIRTKILSDWYAQLERPINRASLLSHLTLFEGKPDGVNGLEDRLAAVTPKQVQDFAARYLVSSNRTVIDRVPAPPDKSKKPTGGAK
jgi:predicted Zn-dependent peptidase